MHYTSDSTQIQFKSIEFEFEKVVQNNEIMME